MPDLRLGGSFRSIAVRREEALLTMRFAGRRVGDKRAIDKNGGGKPVGCLNTDAHRKGCMIKRITQPRFLSVVPECKNHILLFKVTPVASERLRWGITFNPGPYSSSKRGLPQPSLRFDKMPSAVDACRTSMALVQLEVC